MKRILLMVYLFAVAVSYGQQTSAKANGVNNPIIYNQQKSTNAIVTPSTSQSDLKAQGVDKPVFYNPQKRATASLQQTASINGATSALKLQGGNNPLFNSQQYSSKSVASTTADFSSKVLPALDISSIKNGIAPLEKSLFGTYGFIPTSVEGNTGIDPGAGSTSSRGGGPCGVPILEVNQTQDTTCMINIAQGRFSQSYIAQEPYSAGAGIKFRIPPSNGLSLNLSLWDGIPNHGGTKIASGTNLTDGTLWTDVFWDSVVSVIVGNTYHIDVMGDVSLPCISGSTSDPYPGGLLYLGASPWPTYDLVFRTFSCDNSGTGGGTGTVCNQKNPSNNFEHAFETSKNHGLMIATDLQVSDRTNFILEKIKVNIWMEPGETLTSADISFYNHDPVNLQPGLFRNTQLAVVPVSQTVIGNKNGYDVSEVTFEITPELLSGITGASTYWVSVYVDVSRNGDGLIEVTSENIIESTSAVSDDGGEYWNRKIGWDTIYVFEGRCETMDSNFCIQHNPSNNFENAFNTSKSQGQVYATDFQVEAYTDFTMERITINAWMKSGDTLTSADISFYDHDAANHHPAAFRNTQLAVVPVSQTIIGEKSGYDIYEVVFEIAPEILPGLVGASTTYWVSVFMDISSNADGYIEVTQDSIKGDATAYSYDGGYNWRVDEGWDTVYLFEGICENMDGNLCGEVNPANNFQDAFTTSKNQDQVIATDITVPADQDFNLEKITVLIWMAPYDWLTSADITFYENDGNLPGAVRKTLPGVVPVSRTVISEDIYENYVYEMVFEIDPELLPGIAGAKNTYWVSLYLDLEFDNGFIESTTASIKGAPHAYSSDRGDTWGVNEGWDTVYTFEGICEDMGSGGGSGDPCSAIGLSNNFEDRMRFSKEDESILAADITIAADEDMVLETINFIAFIGDAGSGDNANYADVFIYADSGTGSPGALLTSQTNVVPFRQTFIADVDGMQAWSVDLNIADVNLRGKAGEETTYWIGLSVEGRDRGNNHWETSSAGVNGYGVAYAYDGNTFEVDPNYEVVYKFAGSCSPMNPDSCSVSGLSNNFEDRMRFSKEDESIVAADITIAADENMVLETINFIAFIGDPGSGDNANYADVFIYEDSGTGSPGALLTSQTNVVPVRQTFIADVDGMQVWSVDLDIADVNLAGKSGEETTYWIGLSVESRDRGNNHWEISRAGAVGYGLAFAYDGNDFEVDPTMEAVYTFAGICSAMDPNSCSVSGPSNNFEDRMRFSKEDESILAADITIAVDEDMVLETINFIAFIGDPGTGDNANYADVYIYEDSGTGSPGTLLTSQTNVVPVRQTFIADVDGMQVWSIDLDIADVNLAGKSGEETTYWIGLSVESKDRGNCHWEISRAGAVGYGLAFAYDGNDFEVDPTMEVVYTFAGSCNPMNPIPDLCGGTGPSNSFEDMISFAKNGDNIVAADVTILADEDMVLETINFTAFINGIGSGTKVQHVDVFIYEDSGTGSPGTLLTSQTEVVPVLQTVIGDIPSGYQAWSVDLDIAHVTLAGTEGVPTTYWIGLSVRDEDGGNNFWETSSAGVNGYGLAYDHGGGFIVDPTMEVVYIFAGSCSPMDPSGDLCGGTAPSNNFENGKSFTKNLNRITVNDLTINEDEDMLLQTINFNAFIGGVGSGVIASNVDVFIYEDSGTGSPGALITSQINVVPVSQTLIGQNFGFQAWDVELDIDDITLSGQAGAETTYWIGLSLDATDGSNTFWEYSSAGVIGYGLGYNDGTGFVMEPTNEGVYTFAGTCGPMDPSGDSCAITGTSNNFEDGKSFTKNLGRIVANDITIAVDEDMLLENITISAFIGGSGSGVNASNVDVFIYSDSGTGSPGALLTSQLGVVPASQAVIGSNFGFDLWSVDLDISDVNLPGQLGVTTTYWIGISLEPTDGSNTFWEYSSAGVIGYGLGYNDGSGFVMEPTNEGVYTFSGTCSTTTSGPSNDNCSGAIALSCGDSVTGDTSIATDSGGNPASDVYYKYTGSGTAQMVTISLCGGGTDYDSVLRVFDNCDLSNEIAMNDDFCGLQSELSFESNGTSTYYIMVEGSGSDSGNFGLAITCENLSVTDNHLEGFSYYPNPTDGVLNLNSKNNIEMVTIYNLLGQTVLTQKVGAKSATLDISRLSIATYIMRATVNGQVGVYKIVKK